MLSKNNEYDVIIIGGGATGAGTARDCAMRGLKTLIVERLDFTAGATGRNHGLLHSGARYASTDKESAEECIKENMILRRIASHCVDETDGLFITLPEDDLNFQKSFVEACLQSGIKADIIDPKEALLLEPSVNPELIGAVRVPDGSIDPFRLTISNIVDAQRHGADVLTYHELTDFIFDGTSIVGVKLYDKAGNRTVEYRSKVTINAGGIWGYKIAKMAGATVNMMPSKGSLLIMGHRINNMVINRCRKPADADILVPGDTVCVIGTTSTKVPHEEVDSIRPTADEVDILLREGEKLSPALAYTRILRAYSGVRPLVASDDDPSGRSISRGIVCLDHESRDGISGFITITGGKLITYRLMAEWATDLACKKLGVNAKCQTADICLPGSEKHKDDNAPHTTAYKAAESRHGSLTNKITTGDNYSDSLICECEGVSVGEVNYAINELHVHNMINLRRRTRVGMGTCQGELCSCRAAGLLANSHGCSQRAKEDLASFLNERWKGIAPIAWGESLSEAQFTSWIYEGVCGLSLTNNEDIQ